MYLRLGFHLFLKKLLLNSIAVIQLCLTLLAFNMLVCRVNYASVSLHAMRHFPRQDVYFNMVASHIGGMESRSAEIKALLSQYEKELTAEQVKTAYGNTGESIITIRGYGKNTLKYWDISVKGKSLDKNHPLEENIIPCLAYEDQYAIGNRISVIVDDDKDNTEREFTFEVVGLIASNTKLLNISTSSNGAEFDYFFEEKPTYTDAVLLFDYSQVPYFQGYRAGSNSILFFQDGVSQSTKDEIVRECNKYSWTESVDKIRSNSLDELWVYLQSFLPLFICLFLVGIFSTFCLTIMNAVKNIKTFSIYYICGMHWLSSIRICLGYILCIVAGALLLFMPLSAWSLQGDAMEAGRLLINEYNILLSLLLLAVIIVLSTLPSVFLIRRESPLTSLKNGW